MKDHLRTARQEQIETAAYELLAEKGFAGTSMLSIAKRARCSNETLYNWYGDKLGLFRTMVSRNAAEAKTLLENALAQREASIETLDAFGPVLLDFILGEKAVSLNRAAAADATGQLGKALSEAGRETISPLLAQLFEAARTNGELVSNDISDVVDLYLGLLIGDLQIQRAIGRTEKPDPRTMARRAEAATRHLQTLLGP
ncbi:TetR/AcrR family transcriptional regulator [Ruegeria faecimaris]|uniref:TetR/AcrR family transcriptional regulator n=1 Tax=Ruegeria faecimaris TaxID=686389 RepID=UPI002492D206|nr:TetR/AcrR family transcriptional regulator [Ruegeria faecimaris]